MLKAVSKISIVFALIISPAHAATLSTSDFQPILSPIYTTNFVITPELIDSLSTVENISPVPTNGTTTPSDNLDRTDPSLNNNSTSSDQTTPLTPDDIKTTEPTNIPVEETKEVLPERPISTTTPETIQPTAEIPVRPPKLVTPDSSNEDKPVRDPEQKSECPTPNPISNPVCTETEPEIKNILPELPIPILWTPVIGMIISGFIIYYLQNSTSKTSQKVNDLKKANQNREIIKSSRDQNYLEFLELAGKGISSEELSKLNSKITLLGSPETQNLSNQISEAISKKDNQLAKKLLRQFALQIKKEI